MAEVHIPFQHGVNEGVDPKLLPQGWLTRAENVRFRKDGRPASRYGYDYITSNLGAAFAAGNFGDKRSVYFFARSSIFAGPTTGTRGDDGTFIGPDSSNPTFGSVGVPRRYPIVRNQVYTTVACDVASAGGNIYIAYNDRQYDASGTNIGIKYFVVNAGDYRAVSSGTAASGTFFSNPRIVAVGTKILLFYAFADVIRCGIFTAATGSFDGTATVVTATTGRGFSFDVYANDSSTCLLAYESSGVNLKWGTVDTAGVFTSKQDQAIANPARPSICLASNGNVAMCWAEGATFDVGNLHYLVSTTGGTPVTAKTTLDSSGLVTGFPTAGAVPSPRNWCFCWNRSDSKISYGSTFATNLTGTWAFVSRPFSGPNANSAFAWVANHAASGDTAGAATYSLIDVAGSTSAPHCETIAAQTLAQPGAWLTTSPTTHTFVENRRNAGVSVTATILAPSATAMVSVLPVLAGGSFGADIIRNETSDWADVGLTARLNGQLLFAGPRMQEYDGFDLHECGLGEGPEIVTATDSGAGSIEGGTREYVVTLETFDALGRRHRSPPSLPVTITTGASRQVTIAASTPNVSARIYARFRVWRTVDGGTIFYLVSQTGATATPGSGTITAVVDNTTDVALIANEVLYTQGVRGGLSGLLENDEPPPSRFIWAGNNRVLLGGLEEGSAVQWSKLIFPGEPVQFSNTPGFRANIDADVTGIACLDGAWFIGSRDSIWVSQGDGPDDTGAGGTFGDPRKFPSDVGFISQRSILEVPQGLLFQGRSDRIYLLPRGGGAPQWIGQAVRDTLAAYPFVAASRLLQDENIAVFACTNAAGTDGRMLVYDTRIGEWSVDNLFSGGANSARVFHCLDVYNGKLILDGKIAETSVYADDESGSQNRAIVETLVTGDLRAFGALGTGRLRKIALLGEYRSATTFTVEESVDSGVSYQTAASFTPSNSAGDTIRVSYDLPIVRGDAFRFRIISTPTSPGEGMVFNSMTAEVFPERGTPKLANAYRA